MLVPPLQLLRLFPLALKETPDAAASRHGLGKPQVAAAGRKKDGLQVPRCLRLLACTSQEAIHQLASPHSCLYWRGGADQGTADWRRATVAAWHLQPFQSASAQALHSQRGPVGTGATPHDSIQGMRGWPATVAVRIQRTEMDARIRRISYVTAAKLQSCHRTLLSARRLRWLVSSQQRKAWHQRCTRGSSLERGLA